MSSKNIDLANGIVELLNGSDAEYEFAFLAVRREIPFAIEELQQLREVAVSVFTGGVQSERVQRKRFARSYRPAVVIQRVLDGLTPEANEELISRLHILSEQIEAALENEDIAGMGLVAFNEDQDRPPYNLEILSDLNTFYLAIVPTYTSG